MIKSEALEDPPGDTLDGLRAIISALQRSLEDSSAAGSVATGESRYADVQAGGEPHDGQIEKFTDDGVTEPAVLTACWAAGTDCDGVSVDDGGIPSVSCAEDRQPKFRRCGTWYQR